MQGTDLKALRKRAGMTQAEFGEALGITGAYVGEMERGEKTIDARTIFAARQLVEQHEPLRVTVGRFGEKFVVISTEAAPDLPGRISRVLGPGFDTAAEALAEAANFANVHGCPFIPTKLD